MLTSQTQAQCNTLNYSLIGLLMIGIEKWVILVKYSGDGIISGI